MNAPVTIPVVDEFGLAVNAAHLWRGRCIASFARAELVVTETLAVLAPNASTAALLHLVGQRLESLVRVLRGRTDAVAAVEAIDVFRSYADLRNMLCHGDYKVTIDRYGGWQATFTMATFRRGAVERRFLVVDADEAKTIAAKLTRDQQRLSAQLTSIVPTSSYVGREHVGLRTGIV